MEKCFNSRIKNPVPAKIISGKFKGLIGWADNKPNSYGIIAFCNQTGANPYQYNAPVEEIEYI